MPSLTGNAAIDVFIGLSFMYFVLSLVCTSLNEGVAAVLGLRARCLEQGIHSLLDNPGNARAFYKHWRIQALIKPTGRRAKPGRKPSYLPSRAFALTLLDVFAPSEGSGKESLVERAKRALGPDGGAAGHETIRGLLGDALLEAEGKEERLRAALGLVVAVNADSYSIGQRLWKDDALRATVVAQAGKSVKAGSASCAAASPDATPADVAATCVNEIAALGIPLGWSHASSPHSFAAGLGKLAGLLVSAFALTLGAPFWFDLLGRVAHLRGSGPPTSGAENKPASAAAA